MGKASSKTKHERNQEHYAKIKASGKCRYVFCNEPQDGNSIYCHKHKEEAKGLVGKKYRRDPTTKEAIIIEGGDSECSLEVAPAPLKLKPVPQERGLLSITDKIEEMQALFKRRERLKEKLEEYSRLKVELEECEKTIAARVI